MQLLPRPIPPKVNAGLPSSACLHACHERKKLTLSPAPLALAQYEKHKKDNRKRQGS